VLLFSTFENETEAKPVDPVFTLADQLVALREEKQLCKDQLSDIEEALERVVNKLADAMADKEMQNFTRSGKMFFLTTKTRASAVGGESETLYNALEDNGFGDLVKRTVNANSLSSFVKEQIEENEDKLPDWLAALVNVFEQTTVGVRKAAK
jgi:hypothetical protein